MSQIGKLHQNIGLNNVSDNDTKVDSKAIGGPSFDSLLKNVNELTGNKNSVDRVKPDSGKLKFSNHAIERMQLRGIHFSGDDLLKLESAIDKAALKGARETLVLNDQSAMIVSVKNKTVVTVMDKSSLKENVFTNIDSTVVI